MTARRGGNSTPSPAKTTIKANTAKTVQNVFLCFLLSQNQITYTIYKKPNLIKEGFQNLYNIFK